MSGWMDGTSSVAQCAGGQSDEGTQPQTSRKRSVYAVIRPHHANIYSGNCFSPSNASMGTCPCICVRAPQLMYTNGQEEKGGGSLVYPIGSEHRVPENVVRTTAVTRKLGLTREPMLFFVAVVPV